MLEHAADAVGSLAAFASKLGAVALDWLTLGYTSAAVILAQNVADKALDPLQELARYLQRTPNAGLLHERICGTLDVLVPYLLSELKVVADAEAARGTKQSTVSNVRRRLDLPPPGHDTCVHHLLNLLLPDSNTAVDVCMGALLYARTPRCLSPLMCGVAWTLRSITGSDTACRILSGLATGAPGASTLRAHIANVKPMSEKG